MFDEPVNVTTDSFQGAWLEAVKLLMSSHWERYNLIVQVRKPNLFSEERHRSISSFARRNGLLGPKHVAYTIFPQGLYSASDNAGALFDAYNRRRGLYARLHRRKPSWGTYFRRMTHYEGNDGTVNQLASIIKSIRDRENVSRGALTIVVQRPGPETVRPRGGPCLNYLAVQAEPGPPLSLGLLAVYRNHDFLHKAYGNYWGLCNLLRFLAREVNAVAGPMTCVASHAYVPEKKTDLKAFVEGL